MTEQEANVKEYGSILTKGRKILAADNQPQLIVKVAQKFLAL